MNFNNTTPAPPAGNQNITWQFDGSTPPNISAYVPIPANPYDVPCFLTGIPGAGANVLIRTFTRTVAFPANFGGSKGTLGTNPTATAVYTIAKNGTTVGTVSISTGGVFTFASSGGAAQSFVAGDRLTITAPNPMDVTLSDVSMTLAGAA